MIQYLKAKFDLAEIMSFNYNIITSVLTVQGKDREGYLRNQQERLDKVTAARLFRLHVRELNGL